ncbi:MAG: UDP-N-acetylglucosamine 2-epimerase (non-hydrolyzing) [Akkermansia sp.]|nr:UDP-N-acetylglucosamine 2-epimerase (non-hydrolyzing) [Akkermansia sp.]MBR2314742.1 UDP-N-acetylglucosamine 2-epimerase (non-hydrolyzing) [Akkermansia sp.]
MNVKKKIMLVFGTRPEAIKMAPLVRCLQAENKDFETIVCVTGQHREMLDQVLSIFEITPDYDLNIMKSGQTLYSITASVLTELEPILKEVKPDMVLVHGDTTTSMAAALAAFYQQIPVGHVEAGLRTNNPYSPWPEEMNRQITGRIASFHFAPTEKSKDNLLQEKVLESSVHVTGNTVIDALLHVRERLTSSEATELKVVQTILKSGYDVSRLTMANRKLILITGHRRENFGAGFISICEAIKELGEKYPDVDFLYPMHMNPNVRQPIQQVFGTSAHSLQNVFFTEPLEYLSFVYLLSKSHIVLTDSGGIQEEAPGLGKPVLVMRDTTERPEAVVAGTVKLVGTDKAAIIQGISDLLDSAASYARMSLANNPYGDGLACKRICNILKNI